LLHRRFPKIGERSNEEEKINKEKPLRWTTRFGWAQNMESSVEMRAVGGSKIRKKGRRKKNISVRRV